MARTEIDHENRALHPPRAALALSCDGSGVTPPGLEAYVGKDLMLLDPEAGVFVIGPPRGPHGIEFLQRLRALTGDLPDPKDVFTPWWVARFSTGKAAWMVLEAYFGTDVPDTSAVRVHVFERNWKRLVKQAFPTGYRFFLEEAKISHSAPLKTDLLVTTVKSSGPFIIIDGGEKRPAFEQGRYQRQYYAMLGDQFALVRLEDDEGRLVRNNYRWSAPPKGPPVPRRTVQQWTRSLHSTNPVEQLATLVWLTGAHLSSKEPRYKNVNQESREDSRVFEEVKASAETARALSQLQKSTNRWVREYAQLGPAPAGE